MTTPKPLGKNPSKLPVERPSLDGGFGDGRVSHDELLETARGVSQQDEKKIVERKKQDVQKAEAALDQQRLARKGRRGAFLLHVGAFGGVGGIFAAVVAIGTGGTWFLWPLLLWALGLGAHGAWLLREQDKGVQKAEKELASARDELESYVELTPAHGTVTRGRLDSVNDEVEAAIRRRA